MDFNDIKYIDKVIGTPFYIYHRDVFEGNVNDFLSAFKAFYKNVIVGYSFKTNYIPAIVSSAKKVGCMAEVVSGMEYSMALELGYKPSEIIFNGPIKKKEEIFFALNNGSIVNLDSFYELDSVLSFKDLYPDKKVSVGVRVNVNLNEGRRKKAIQSGLDYGRFGFAKDSLEKILSILNRNDVRVISIHGHTSSSDRALDNYTTICNNMLDVVKRYDLDEVRYFNVGGGFFGAAANGISTEGKPSYKDYAKHITDLLLGDEWFNRVSPALVIEPGASVVSNAFSLYTKVYQNKLIASKRFIMVDASVFDIKPSMHSLNLPHEIISEKKQKDELVKVDVVGSTCMEKDIILKDVMLPLPEKDDYIRFDGVGAYTQVFTPTFINYISPVIEYNNKGISIIRRRQIMSDILAPFREGL